MGKTGTIITTTDGQGGTIRLETTDDSAYEVGNYYPYNAPLLGIAVNQGDYFDIASLEENVFILGDPLTRAKGIVSPDRQQIEVSDSGSYEIAPGALPPVLIIGKINLNTPGEPETPSSSSFQGEVTFSYNTKYNTADNASCSVATKCFIRPFII